MSAEAIAFRVIVRRVATGSTPFQWQVERDDTLALVEVSPQRFRSMQEAYDAGQAWLSRFLASRPAPKRPPISFEEGQPKPRDALADEAFMDLEDEDAEEADDDDLTHPEFDEDASVLPGW